MATTSNEITFHMIVVALMQVQLLVGAQKKSDRSLTTKQVREIARSVLVLLA
jgi:hypothetical protein